MAQYRRASEDRIYGITQVYGISCRPLLPGGDPTSRLHVMDDECGEKVTDKYPLLRLFLEPFDSAWSTHISSSYHVTSLFESLRVIRKGDKNVRQMAKYLYGCQVTVVKVDENRASVWLVASVLI